MYYKPLNLDDKIEKSQLPQHLPVVDILKVEKVWGLHQSLHPLQIEVAELVPLRQLQQRVVPFHRLVFFLGIKKLMIVKVI